MTNNAQEYDIAEIRNLLTEAFTAKDLRRFCYDRPTFRPIVDEFAPDHGVADMVDQVIDYCQVHLLWNELLTDVALVRRRRYARFRPRLGESAPPPAPGTAAAVATARAWPAWYWVAGASIVVLLVIVGVWWLVFRPENGPGSQPTETRVASTAAAPTPFLEFFRVFPSEVQPGTPVSISWHVQNAESVEVRPGGIFRGKPTYEISDRPREDETYELYINGTPTPIESRLVRHVIPPPGAPAINDFSAMPSQVIEGVTDKITLSWDTSDATSVDIAGVATNLRPVWNITIDPPAETTEYKLVAENDAGRRSHSIQVFVVTPTPAATLALPATPTPTLTLPPTPAPTRTLPPTLAPTRTPAPTPTISPPRSPTAPPGPEGMVYIPGGTFVMGSDDPQDCPDGCPDDCPPHQVTVSAFWLDEHEVTNAAYRECVSAQACEAPHESERLGGSPKVNSATQAHYYGNPQHDHFPVVWVSWYDARDYCQWRGKRLPTEAEWEWAAKGPDGFLYPWGNKEPSSARANYKDAKKGDTTAVGSYEPSAAFGLYDMAGNVWEWTSSLSVPYPYRLDPEHEDPGSKGMRVLRGGSWVDGGSSLHSALRNCAGTEPDYPLANVGFRCAKSQ